MDCFSGPSRPAAASTRRCCCFCMEDDGDPSSPGPRVSPSFVETYFSLDCGHAFHRRCLRDFVRHDWACATNLPKMIDTKGRKVVFLRCPLCRTPVSPAKTRELQVQHRRITVTTTLREDPPGDRCGTGGGGGGGGGGGTGARHEYNVSIETSRFLFAVFETYDGRNLPLAAGGGGGNYVERLFAEDYVVRAESSISCFEVTLTRLRPVAKVLLRYTALSKNLPSLEADAAEEEESQRLVEECLSRNEVRVVTCGAHDEEFRKRAARLGREEEGEEGGGGGGGEEAEGTRGRRPGSSILRSLLADETMSDFSPSTSRSTTPSPPPLPSLPPPPPPCPLPSTSSFDHGRAVPTTTTTTRPVVPDPGGNVSEAAGGTSTPRSDGVAGERRGPAGRTRRTREERYFQWRVIQRKRRAACVKRINGNVQTALHRLTVLSNNLARWSNIGRAILDREIAENGGGDGRGGGSSDDNDAADAGNRAEVRDGDIHKHMQKIFDHVHALQEYF